MIMGDIIISISHPNKFFKWKLSKEIAKPSHTKDQLDLDILTNIPPNKYKQTDKNNTFSNTGHVISYKVSLSKCQRWNDSLIQYSDQSLS